MAKIAVYEKFYGRDLEHDIVSEALADMPHEVIARSFRLREAVRQILQFKDGNPKDHPDIVILGGRLEGELEYKSMPETITEPCTVKHRRWYGTQEVPGQRTTFLLPHYKVGAEEYHFPSVTSAHPRLPHDTERQWDPIQVSVAAPLLSRMVETYLPDTVRIGISRDNMYDSVLHQTVWRGHDDAVQQIQGHVQYYGRIADMR